MGKAIGHGRQMEYACQMLTEQELTCAFVSGGQVYISKERGVKPLLDCYYQKAMPAGFSAADKVVGKAAAFLYVLLGVGELHAQVISRPALEVLQKYNVPVSYELLTDAIRNRAGTGFCPMETAVLDLDSPKDALRAIEETRLFLQEVGSQKENER